MADDPKDDEFDVDMGDGDGGGDDGQPDPDADKTPEELRAELAKLRAAQAKANKEAEKLRLAKKAERDKAAAAKAGAAEADDKVSAAEQRVKMVAVRTAGAAAILEAGFSGDRKAARELTRLLDLDDLDVDEDGEVDGLDDAVAELKEKYPRLFKDDEDDERRPAKKAVRRIDTKPGGSGRESKPRSSAELVAARLRGGR